ncbi:class A beta-lactamase BlaA [soil metagenome]
MNLSSFKQSLLLATMISVVSAYIPVLASDQKIKSTSIETKLTMLEGSFDGRIGISAVNTANNSRIQYHAEKRFPIQSTFKVMLAAAILKQSMTNSHLLQQKITYTKHDLVVWSPITEKHLADGMTISELCAAVLMYSDNSAANLLMKKLGGPEAVTVFARSIGDNTFSVSRWEAELNSNPNNFRDTSTPAAMEKSLQLLILGNVLAPPQREQLVTWMKGNTTGDTQIRAGVPKGWIVADKTGSGSYGIANDIGIVWPSKCAPIVVTIYSVQNKKDATRRNDVIASATSILLDEFAKADKCIKMKSY